MEIYKGLQVVENWNSTNALLRYGKGGRGWRGIRPGSRPDPDRSGSFGPTAGRVAVARG